MKVNLPRATTWIVDSTNPDKGVLTNGDGLVFEMRRCDDGVGWKPVLTSGRALWLGYGTHSDGQTILRRVGESLIEAWAAEVEAKSLPVKVKPLTVAAAVSASLGTGTC